MIFEKARDEDRQQVNALALEVHSLHVLWRPDIYEMPSELYTLDRFREAMESLYVAREGGKVVGYAAINIRDYDWAGMVKRRVLYIDEFGVSQAHRRQGIGRFMMEQLGALGRQLGCTGMQLGVYPQNEAAVAFYKSCGFEVQSVTLSSKLS